MCSENTHTNIQGLVFLLSAGVILKLLPVTIPRHTAHGAAPLPACTTLRATVSPWDLPAWVSIIPHPDHFPACEWIQGPDTAQDILHQPDLHVVTPA